MTSTPSSLKIVWLLRMPRKEKFIFFYVLLISYFWSTVLGKFRTRGWSRLIELCAITEGKYCRYPKDAVMQRVISVLSFQEIVQFHKTPNHCWVKRKREPFSLFSFQYSIDHLYPRSHSLWFVLQLPAIGKAMINLGCTVYSKKFAYTTKSLMSPHKSFNDGEKSCWVMRFSVFHPGSIDISRDSLPYRGFLIHTFYDAAKG